MIGVSVRIGGPALALTAALLATAVSRAAPSPVEAEGGRCRQESPTTFVLDGPTDAAMLACVRANFSDATTEIVLTSTGGNVGYALDIAERIGGARRVMRVRKECNSSCANYFLPLASRVVVEPDAMILLHGGVDRRLVTRAEQDRGKSVSQALKQGARSRAEAEATADDGLAKLRANAERQRRFVRARNIPLGWLFYRETEGVGPLGLGPHVTGSPGRASFMGGGRFVLAEEAFLRSCLPGVEIAPYQHHLDARIARNPKGFARASREGVVRSGGLRCRFDSR